MKTDGIHRLSEVFVVREGNRRERGLLRHARVRLHSEPVETKGAEIGARRV